MSKPSEKAMQLARSIEVGCGGFSDNTLSHAAAIETHTAEALAEHQRVIEMADGALGSLLGHLEANFDDNVSCWVKQGKAARAEIEKLRKESNNG